MSENRYKIVFDGALLPGVEATTAKLNLAELFKSDVAAIERLFSGRPVALKRDLSQADAQTYLQALTKTGIDARIEREPQVELNLSEVHEHTPADPPPAPDPESPYAPPRAAVGEALPAFATLKAFSFDGRIGRLRYLAWTMVLMLVTFGISAMLVFFGLTLISTDSSAGLILGGLLAFTLIVVFGFISIQFSVQRLHDIGWSGWLWLLTLVPIVGSFFPFVMMLMPGNHTANRYGAPPPPNSPAVKILSALWLVFTAILLIGGLSGGLTAIHSEYESATERLYESDSVTAEGIEDQTAVEAEPAPNSADDAAEEARPPVDSAKE
ncbi:MULTISPECIES: DUF805 domain-containing protein [unclassified Pseudomonas]|jgi:uncharacterized membrane protein YhaH (DUF805 family)|uniref:DUF805 domain-containing protein n=1 Tax=unclassified Pseudomonas TaxID=196821 RepID=UPI0009C632C2|nr:MULTISPECIES: DUF805 domain-containing protein [unclassified Pseudomonas]OPK06734.1 hypothetical protein BZ163_29460 [Pseudomonas sp. VI4.1]QCY14941.1 DUF805 domain-containing protein [Pseudomonas sp. MPC6]